MKPSEIATLVTAVIGAVLGVINTLQNVTRDRVKLRVSTKLSYPLQVDNWEQHPYLGIDVVNQSPFPLTISQIGVEQKGPPVEIRLGIPLMLDGIALPRRMD